MSRRACLASWGKPWRGRTSRLSPALHTVTRRPGCPSHRAPCMQLRGGAAAAPQLAAVHSGGHVWGGGGGRRRRPGGAAVWGRPAWLPHARGTHSRRVRATKLQCKCKSCGALGSGRLASAGLVSRAPPKRALHPASTALACRPPPPSPLPRCRPAIPGGARHRGAGDGQHAAACGARQQAAHGAQAGRFARVEGSMVGMSSILLAVPQRAPDAEA